MCGIVGILGHEPVTAPLIDPLKREERREVRLGYGIIAPHDRVFEKTVSNMQEVVARQGKIILITDPQGAHDVHMGSLSTHASGHARHGDATRVCHPGAADRLPYSGRDGHRRRSAAQPRQVGHGGVIEGFQAESAGAQPNSGLAQSVMPY